jgi:hypothetical protein
MNNRLSDSNVYYFPSTTPTAPAPTAVEPVRFMRRLRNAWWRLRLALSEIRTILRRPSQRLTLDDYVGLLEFEDDQQRPRRRRRSGQPGRLIDFETARLRLRPAPQA